MPVDEKFLLEQLSDDELFNMESGRSRLNGRISRNNSTGPELAGGDLDAQWEMAESVGDETVGGSMMTPDQNVVDEFGEAFGLMYDLGEELHCGEKEFERDRHRWELDPASSEDYIERVQTGRGAWRWRHFNH